jgi:indolepyruvate ferredoxin oxidoreductase
MGKPVPLKDVTLDDKYDLAAEQVFLSGTQAIVRLLMMQQERDRRAGLNTAGFVSGYRGSPLGGLDQQMFKAAKQLKRHEIVFQPGLNEDLAATACWGTQQAELHGEGKFQGVFWRRSNRRCVSPRQHGGFVEIRRRRMPVWR